MGNQAGGNGIQAWRHFPEDAGQLFAQTEAIEGISFDAAKVRQLLLDRLA